MKFSRDNNPSLMLINDENNHPPARLIRIYQTTLTWCHDSKVNQRWGSSCTIMSYFYVYSRSLLFAIILILWAVSIYIMYSWALCYWYSTNLHLYLLALSGTNPHGWGVQLFSIYFHCYHHQEDTSLHHNTILNSQKFQTLFTFWTFYFEILKFMSTTKTTRMDSKTFFYNFLVITIVKRALQYTIFDQNLKKLHVTYFCAGFTLKFFFRFCS